MPIELAAESVESRAQLAALVAATDCESSGPVGAADADEVMVVTMVETDVDGAALDPPPPHPVRAMTAAAAATTTRKIFCTLRR
jgi:hypothetical protein